MIWRSLRLSSPYNICGNIFVPVYLYQYDKVSTVHIPIPVKACHHSKMDGVYAGGALHRPRASTNTANYPMAKVSQFSLFLVLFKTLESDKKADEVSEERRAIPGLGDSQDRGGHSITLGPPLWTWRERVVIYG